MSGNVMERSDGHLSEDQVDEALMGSLAEAAGGHLAGCAACQREVEAARLPIESFKALSLAWSERRSATLPTALPVGLLGGVARRRRMAWGSAATALLAVTIAVPAGLHFGVRTTAAGANAATVQDGRASGTTDEQMARDNQMLKEIEQEVNSSGADPSTLGLGEVSVRTGTLRQSGTTQD